MSGAKSILGVAIATMLLCGAVLVFVKVFIRRDSQPARANATLHQMRQIQGTIEQVVDDQIRAGVIPKMDSVLTLVLKERGENYLRSEVDSDLHLLINPEIQKWTDSITNSTMYSNHLAIVSPVIFINQKNQQKFYLAIDFAGQKTTITNLPSW